ncbi:TlpA disulfide reductase family protein [Devosia sp.]|uniref:TlpA disulfide reductase family protein n=1 Tax=Devosia sp. TaxID=1871048 RepID=UPI0035B024BE
MTDKSPATPSQKRPPAMPMIVLIGVALALAAGLVLGNFMPARATQCEAQPARAAALDAAAVGALAALSGTGTGRGYADMTFVDAAGKPAAIRDFAGKKLLVNFWASWCVPCRAEMPALDALAGDYNSDGFMVLPVNLDIGEGGLAKAGKFLAEGGFAQLPLYADSSFAAFERLKTEAVAIGLPATLLLDEKGCELAVLQGPAEWDTPDGHKVIAALIGG